MSRLINNISEFVITYVGIGALLATLSCGDIEKKDQEIVEKPVEYSETNVKNQPAISDEIPEENINNEISKPEYNDNQKDVTIDNFVTSIDIQDKQKTQGIIQETPETKPTTPEYEENEKPDNLEKPWSTLDPNKYIPLIELEDFCKSDKEKNSLLEVICSFGNILERWESTLGEKCKPDIAIYSEFIDNETRTKLTGETIKDIDWGGLTSGSNILISEELANYPDTLIKTLFHEMGHACYASGNEIISSMIGLFVSLDYGMDNGKTLMIENTLMNYFARLPKDLQAIDMYDGSTYQFTKYLLDNHNIESLSNNELSQTINHFKDVPSKSYMDILPEDTNAERIFSEIRTEAKQQILKYTSNKLTEKSIPNKLEFDEEGHMSLKADFKGFYETIINLKHYK